jgi:hypothetical protein
MAPSKPSQPAVEYLWRELPWKKSMPVVRLLLHKRLVLGSAKGEFTVPDDFNDPLPKEIEDLFYQ